jgi:hypothetical protein
MLESACSNEDSSILAAASKLITHLFTNNDSLYDSLLHWISCSIQQRLDLSQR